jgi:hypothetical protein
MDEKQSIQEKPCPAADELDTIEQARKESISFLFFCIFSFHVLHDCATEDMVLYRKSQRAVFPHFAQVGEELEAGPAEGEC